MLIIIVTTLLTAVFKLLDGCFGSPTIATSHKHYSFALPYHNKQEWFISFSSFRFCLLLLISFEHANKRNIILATVKWNYTTVSLLLDWEQSLSFPRISKFEWQNCKQKPGLNCSCLVVLWAGEGGESIFLPSPPLAHNTTSQQFLKGFCL